MDEIQNIVQQIVWGCKKLGQPTSEVIAAFVARTIVQENTDVFKLDAKLNDALVREVVDRSIQRLMLRDSPSLDTMKMQVAFDSSYLQEDERTRALMQTRQRKLTVMKKNIIDTRLRDANDFETLTALYRHIFEYLAEFYRPERSLSRDAEREIAAALESVFPRVGVKMFMQLQAHEKSTQLDELAQIVLGIRLFNREVGRGGAGIDDMDERTLGRANELLQELSHDVDQITEVCASYQSTITYAHHLRKTREADGKAEEGGADARARTVSDEVLDRWSEELANRRQYLSYLQSLLEDAAVSAQKATHVRETFKLELFNLQRLVGSRNTIPKEQVYPKFLGIAKLWMQIADEKEMVMSRLNTYTELQKFARTYIPTLTEEDVPVGGIEAQLQAESEARASGLAGRGAADHLRSEVDAAASAADADAGDTATGAAAAQPRSSSAKTTSTSTDEEDVRGLTPDTRSLSPASAAVSGVDASAQAGAKALDADGDGQGAKGDASEAETGQADGAATTATAAAGASSESKASAEYEAGATSAAGATLIMVHSSPEFMQLPLQYQGFCCWSLVDRRGLLLPGKPSLGVVRFDNAYYVFSDQAAVTQFMSEPQRYVSGVKELAARHPEYIHLLRMQNVFPSASISRLLNQPDPAAAGAGDGPSSKTRDAETETPTHFVEKRIDVRYHWNEWELRRRALQAVNLRKCRTTSTQTDLSHFRRENDSQVYPPKEQETQTTRESGSNPTRYVAYLTGLRGKYERTINYGQPEQPQQQQDAATSTASGTGAKPTPIVRLEYG